MAYDKQQIAHELDETAAGRAHYGNALYVALDFPGLSKSDRLCIQSWIHGTATTATASWHLERIAITIREGEAPRAMVREHCLMTAVYLQGMELRDIFTNGFTIGKTYKGQRSYLPTGSAPLPWLVYADDGQERFIRSDGHGGAHLYNRTGTAGRFIIEELHTHTVVNNVQA
jgi:hypothetical protein